MYKRKNSTTTSTAPGEATFEQYCETHANAQFVRERFKDWLSQENMNGARTAMTQTPEVWYIVFSKFLKEVIKKPPKKGLTSSDEHL